MSDASHIIESWERMFSQTTDKRTQRIMHACWLIGAAAAGQEAVRILGPSGAILTPIADQIMAVEKLAIERGISEQ